MRPIKFRAWDTEDRRMILLDKTYVGMLSCLQEEPSWKVMQFTGLHDQHGKEIWEGDVVRDRNGGLMYCIVWNMDRFVLEHPKTMELGVSLRGFYDELEVLGNIHEHPDLVKAHG